MSAFYGDNHAELEWLRLHDRFGIRQIIETGTNMGDTCEFFAGICGGSVFSIELNRERFEAARERMAGSRNVRLLLGSSQGMIRAITPDGPTMFFLDAHGEPYWPILDELKAIRDARFKPPIIVIDDIKVPGRPFQFDTYGGVENTLELSAPLLREIYGGDFDWFYNNRSEASGPLFIDGATGVGKLYVGPPVQFTGMYFTENGNNYSNL